MNVAGENIPDFLYHRLKLVTNMLESAVLYCGLEPNGTAEFLFQNVLRVAQEGLKIADNADAEAASYECRPEKPA